jgi:hypothetical protein
MPGRERPRSGRRTRCGWRPRAAPAASAGTTWGGWSPGCGPTSSCGRATTSPTCWTPLAGLVLGPERTARHVFVEGDYVVKDSALVGAATATGVPREALDALARRRPLPGEPS